MLRWWINWMLVKPWLLLKYLAGCEFLERRRFKAFWADPLRPEYKAHLVKYPPACVKSHRISFIIEIRLNSLGSEPKNKMLAQSWASQIALDIFPTHTHFYFFISSKFHGLVPCTWMIPVMRGLGSPDGSTLQVWCELLHRFCPRKMDYPKLCPCLFPWSFCPSRQNGNPFGCLIVRMWTERRKQSTNKRQFLLSHKEKTRQTNSNRPPTIPVLTWHQECPHQPPHPTSGSSWSTGMGFLQVREAPKALRTPNPATSVRSPSQEP